MPKVLIVDDSPTARAVLSAILEAEPELELVGVATNGHEAIELAHELRPDVITMDINMPGMDGLEATREIMIEAPTPIIVVSASTRAHEVETSMQLLDAGAMTVLQKPIGPFVPEYESLAKEIRETIRNLAGLVVVRRRRPRAQRFGNGVGTTEPAWQSSREHLTTANRVLDLSPADGEQPKQLQAIGIVSSTGGPPALASVLGVLPRDFPIPILLVQHIVAGFLDGFTQWLDGVVPPEVRTANDGELLQPGTVYVAPAGRHLGVTAGRRIKLETGPAIEGFRPAGTYLLKSLASSFRHRCAGVIMTGMGRDGVEGMVAIQRAGGSTLAQDESTCVVFGMPRAAIERRAADQIVPLEAIGQHLIQLARDSAEQEL